jgi:hypothetical protein
MEAVPEVVMDVEAILRSPSGGETQTATRGSTCSASGLAILTGAAAISASAADEIHWSVGVVAACALVAAAGASRRAPDAFRRQGRPEGQCSRRRRSGGR